MKVFDVYGRQIYYRGGTDAVDYLDDIGDVNVTSPTDGDLIYWDDGAGEWKAKAMKGVVSELASLNSSTKVVEQPASISDHLEGTPTEDLATKAPTSEWAYDHDAATTGVHGVGAGTVAKVADIVATKLDDFATPDDNTDLNASTSVHGLLKKLDDSATSFLNGKGNWTTPAGAGTVTTSGSPIANDIARFTGATAIEGRSYAELKADLDLEIGTDVLAEQTIGIADDNLLEVDGSPSDGQYARFTSNGLVGVTNVITLTFIIDGGGSAITTGVKGFLEIPFAATITRATMLADQSGSIVVDVWKCTYSAFDISTHPVDGDSITSSAPLTISTAVKSQDSTLTGWTTAITAGDVLAFNVDSITTCERVTISIRCTKT